MLHCIQDGRLRQDDQLISINGTAVMGLSHNAVLNKIQSVSHSGDLPLRLVVSRNVNDSHQDNDDSFSDIDVSYIIYLFCISIYLFVCLYISIYLFYISINMYIFMPIHLFIHPSIYPSIYLYIYNMTIYLSSVVFIRYRRS